MEKISSEQYKRMQYIIRSLLEKGLSRVESKKIANVSKNIVEAFSVVENEYWWRDDYELERGKVAAILKNDITLYKEIEAPILGGLTENGVRWSDVREALFSIIRDLRPKKKAEKEAYLKLTACAEAVDDFLSGLPFVSTKTMQMMLRDVVSKIVENTGALQMKGADPSKFGVALYHLRKNFSDPAIFRFYQKLDEQQKGDDK